MKKFIKKELLIFVGPFGLMVGFCLGILYGVIVFSLIFFIAAIISSIVYGYQSYEINWGLPKPDNKNKWALYREFWLSGLGNAIGYISLYYFLIQRLKIFDPNAITDFRVAYFDLIILLIIFLGVTGYIPYAILGVGGALQKIFKIGQ